MSFGEEREDVIPLSAWLVPVVLLFATVLAIYAAW